MLTRPIRKCCIIGIALACACAAIANPSPRRAARNVVRDWDYNGKVILGHLGNDLCEWSARSGRLLRRLSGHKAPIATVKLSSNGKEAITTSGGFSRWPGPHPPMTCLWDLAHGRLIKKLDNEGQASFSPDGRRILTGNWAEGKFYAHIGDARTGKRLASFPVSAISLAFSYNHKDFLPSNGLAKVVVYDTRTGAAVGKGNLRYIFDSISTFGPSDPGLIRWGQGGLNITDFKARKAIFQLPDSIDARNYYVPVAQVSPKGAQILAGSSAGVDVYALHSRRRLRHLSPPSEGPVTSLSVNEKHVLIQRYADSNGGPLMGSEWNYRTEKILARFDGAPVCFSKRGKTFLTCPVDVKAKQKLSIISAKTGAVIRTINLDKYYPAIKEE